jgi:hypothetical protein
MVDGVTWPTTVPPGWTVEWDVAPAEEEQEESLLQIMLYETVNFQLLRRL